MGAARFTENGEGRNFDFAFGNLLTFGSLTGVEGKCLFDIIMACVS